MARHFSIGFGMVNIPCLLEGAATDKTISLNNVHTECKSRLKAPKWCPTCQREVQMDEIIKATSWTRRTPSCWPRWIWTISGWKASSPFR